MENLALVFGGNSCEAEVSVVTALQTLTAIDKKKYKIYPVYLKNGEFTFSQKYDSIDSFNGKKNPKKVTVEFSGRGLYAKKKGKMKLLTEIDKVLLCTHGGDGENGALQGYFEIHRIPYTSCGVLESAICMDKALSKKLFASYKLLQTPYIVVDKSDAQENEDKVLKAVAKKIPFPLIVKPNNQGSSIGIKVANNLDELKEAFAVAFEYCERIIVEKALEGCKEFSVAVCGGETPIISAIEKIIPWKNFLSFEDKYIENMKKSGINSELPAEITPEQADSIIKSTEKVCKELNLQGVVRFDYLMNDEGKVFINEINTIPGSLSYRLFEPNGLGHQKLIEILLQNAKNKFDKDNGFHKTFNSNILRGDKININK